MDPATANDYILTDPATLTIPAGQRAGAGLLTITAVDNALDDGDRTVRLSATADNMEGEGVSADRASATITIIDDDVTIPDDDVESSPGKAAGADATPTP